MEDNSIVDIMLHSELLVTYCYM